MNETETSEIVWDREQYLSFGTKMRVQVWVFVVLFFFTKCWSLQIMIAILKQRLHKNKGKINISAGLDAAEIVIMFTVGAAVCE